MDKNLPVLSANDNPIVSGIIITIIGLGILILAIYKTIKSRNSTKSCTLEVTGKVVGVEPLRINEGPANYFTVCTYCINGIDYTAKSKTGGKQQFNPGDDIIICCDPNNPQDFILPAESSSVTVYRIVLYIIAAVTVAAGVLLLATGGNQIVI